MIWWIWWVLCYSSKHQIITWLHFIWHVGIKQEQYLSVLGECPDPADMLDTKRNLPFHLASSQRSHVSTTVLHTLLLDNYPISVTKTRYNTLLPLHDILLHKPKGSDALLFVIHLIYQYQVSLDAISICGDLQHATLYTSIGMIRMRFNCFSFLNHKPPA